MATDTTRRLITEFVFKGEKAAVAIENIMRLLDGMKGLADQDLLARALSAPTAVAQVQTLNDLLDDFRSKQTQALVKGGASPAKAASLAREQTNLLRKEFKQMIPEANAALRPQGYDQLAAHINKATVSLTSFRSQMTGPLAEGSDVIQRITGHIAKLTDQATLLSNLPIISPATKEHITTTMNAAAHLRDVLGKIKGYGKINLFSKAAGSKFISDVDVANADKLLNRMRGVKGYWTKNASIVKEMYDAARKGDEDAIASLQKKRTDYDALVAAGQKFYDAASKGELPDKYINKFKDLLQTFNESDGAIKRIKTSAQEFAKTMSGSNVDKTFNKVLSSVKAVSDELGGGRLQESAKKYGNALEGSIQRAISRQHILHKVVKEYWDVARANLDRWHQEYTSALSDITSKQRAFELSGMEKPKQQEIIGKEQLRTARTYLFNLAKQETKLKGVIKHQRLYINETRARVKAGQEDNKVLTEAQRLLEQYKATLSDVQKRMKNVGTTAKRSNQMLKEGLKGSEQTFMGINQEVKDFGYYMDVAIQKIIRYRVAFTVMHEIVRFFKSTLDIPKQIEHQFAQLKKVMDESTTDFNQLRQSAFGFAIDFGVSLKEVTDTMFVWAQQGKTQNEIINLTQATLLGMTAANLTAKQSVEALTAAIKQFDITAEDSYIVMDKLLNVQRNFAVTAQDLADSIKLLGATARQMGMDMNELFGVVAAVAEVTRKSGKAVANSLKTVFARIVKKDALDSIQRVGIAVYNLEGQLRPLGTILDDIAGKWSRLTKSQKLHIAHVVGGIRRYNDFLVLMDNYGAAMAATTISLNSTGAAHRAALLEQETFHRSLESAKIGFQRYTEAVGSTAVGFFQLGHAIKGLSSMLVDDTGKLTAFGKAATNIVSGLGTLIATLLTAKGIAFTFALIMGILTKAAFAQVIAGTELTITNKAVSASAIRAGLATEYNWLQQGILYSKLIATGKASATVVGTNVALKYSMQSTGAATTVASTGLQMYTGNTAVAAAATGTFAGILNVLKVTLLGVGRAIGWWGLALGVIAVISAKYLINLGKQRTELEQIKVSSTIHAEEQIKLLKIYEKSSRSIIAHAANLYKLRIEMEKGTKSNKALNNAFNDQIRNISKIAVSLGQGALLPSMFPEDANKQLEEADIRINEIFDTVLKTTRAMEEARNLALRNIRTAVSDLEADIVTNQVLLTSLSKTTDAAYNVRDALSNILNIMNGIDDSATKGAAIKLFREFVLGAADSEDAIDGMRNAIDKGFVGDSKLKKALNVFADKLEDYWKVHGEASGEALAVSMGTAFEDATSDAFKGMITAVDSELEIVYKNTKDTFKGIEVLARRATRAISGNYNVGGRVPGTRPTGLIIDDSDAAETSAKAYGVLSTAMGGYINSQASVVKTLEESISKEIKLKEALTDNLEAYGVLTYGIEEYKSLVKESISAMSKAYSVLRSYGVVIDDVKKTTYDMIKNQVELATATGKLTSAFDQHLSSLNKGVKMAYDAYMLQKAKLSEQEREIVNQDKLQKSILTMQDIVIKGVKEHISLLKNTRMDLLQDQTEESAFLISDLTKQIDSLSEALNTIEKSNLEELYNLTGKERKAFIGDYVKALQESANLNKEQAEAMGQQLETALGLTGNIKTRIAIAKELVKQSKKEYQTALMAAIVETTRIKKEKRAFKDYFQNVKDKQTFVISYYKNLEKLSSKLSGAYHKQQLSIKETSIDLEYQLSVTKALESVIDAFVDTSGQATVEFLEMREATGDTEKAIQALAIKMGGYKDLSADVAETAALMIDRLAQQAELKKNLLRLSSAQNLIEQSITGAYKIRSDISKKYYSELEALQSSAGASEEKQIQTRIDGLNHELSLLQQKDKDMSGFIDNMHVLSSETAEQQRLMDKTGDTMKEKAILAEIAWLEIQKRLVSVHKTLEDMANVTENVADLMSSTLVNASEDYMNNIKEARDLEQEMADMTSEIAILERNLAREKDPQKYADIAFELKNARDSYKEINEEADKLRSVMHNLGELAKNFAQGLADIVVEINQEQLKSALQEIIQGSTFEKQMAETLSGGLIQASTVGSKEYYTKIADAGKIAADNMYFSIIRAVNDAAPVFGAAIRQANVNAYTGAGGTGGSGSGTGTGASGTTLGVGATNNTSATNDLTTIMNRVNTSLNIFNETLGQTNIALTALTTATKAGTGAAQKPIALPQDPSMKATTRALHAISGQLGMMLGTAAGGGGQGAGIGASLGSVALGAAFGPWGSILGGIGGGLFGRLFDDDEKPESPPIPPVIETDVVDSNTDATKANTYSMNKLSIAVNDIREEMINAPSRFVLPPQYVGGATTGQGGFSVSISVAGSLDSTTARQLTDDINDVYKNQYRRQGYSTRLT